MLISEIRDLFKSKYKLESRIRKTDEIDIDNKLLASFISQAQQDIQRRLSVVEASTTIALGTTSNVYNLPSNFGRHKHAYIGSTLLGEKSSRFIREQIALGNTGDWYAIYQAGNTQQILTTYTSGTLTVYYYPDFRYYQPSVTSIQDWGTFNGIVFTGKLMLPDRYDMAILYYMLSQVVPDYYAFYEKEIRSLKGSRVASMGETLDYNFGGLEEDAYPIGASGGTTVTVITTIAGTTDADKYARIRCTYTGGAYSVEDKNGWTSDPAVANNGTSIVITSADSEFTNFIHIDINNENFTYTMSADTITITPDPTTDWGDVEIVLAIWN
ncbi:MAG TPA: hypothetical protein VKD08_03055 [Ignavibacteriaceae bacterium]|nr:hypothetical protein [Ignavibacteriaceae bacterium]